MFSILIAPRDGHGLDRVHIWKTDSKIYVNLAGRRSAIEWLTGQGCCPGAAEMLHGVELYQPCQIKGPEEEPFALDPN